MSQNRLDEFEPVFFPKSIAVVGASHDETKFGTRYLQALINAGFKGPLYPIHPRFKESLGLRAYPSLTSVPDPVDYVIVSIPARFVIDLLDDCATKGVKVVQFFTAGFSETGEEEGIELEREMVRKAREGGFRIIGPNCIGIYSPAASMPYGPAGFVGELGRVAFISQSGGHGGGLLQEGITRGIAFSKIVSFGNGCDLDSVNFLEYFRDDPQTEIIGAYLEGAREGRRLFQLIAEITKTKPVVVWKGGRTPVGAQAAASHTGSLAGSDAIWSAALRQAGAIKVDSLEELADTILAFQCIGCFKGHRVALVTGLIGGGGGASVSSSDDLTSQGLEVPPFTDHARAKLKAILPEAGYILRNPLDMGSSGGHLGTLQATLEAVLAESQIELVMVHASFPQLLLFLPRETAKEVNQVIIDFRRSQDKPIVIISAPTSEEAGAGPVEKTFPPAKIPVYPTFARAARAIVNLVQYWQLREGQA